MEPLCGPRRNRGTVAVEGSVVAGSTIKEAAMGRKKEEREDGRKRGGGRECRKMEREGNKGHHHL